MMQKPYRAATRVPSDTCSRRCPGCWGNAGLLRGRQTTGLSPTRIPSRRARGQHHGRLGSFDGTDDQFGGSKGDGSLESPRPTSLSPAPYNGHHRGDANFDSRWRCGCDQSWPPARRPSQGAHDRLPRLRGHDGRMRRSPGDIGTPGGSPHPPGHHHCSWRHGVDRHRTRRARWDLAIHIGFWICRWNAGRRITRWHELERLF